MSTRAKTPEPRPFAAARVVEFEKRIHRSPDGCWLWQGVIADSGYGLFNYDGRQGRAHRFSYEHHAGAIDDGLLVLHTCDVRHCVNPAHLHLGTPAQNTADMMRRGRQRTLRGRACHFTILTEEQTREIARRYEPGLNQSRPGNARQLATEFGISKRRVCEIGLAAAEGRVA